MVEPGHAPLADRYELVELLATGGMGQVWRARDLLLSRRVAVKVLRSEFAGDPTFVARFRAEAQHAAVLTHESIVAVHDYGEVPAPDGRGQLAYLVMEMVDGEPLSALLAREGRIDTACTLALLRQAAAALAAAHAAGVVHRDVKPGNVLVSADGRVSVTDFGIAWSAASVPLTQTGHVVGTASYLSPEQAEGGKAGPASDVYGLGMIAYECLAGRRAFDGDNAVQIALRHIRDVPDPLPDDVPDAVRSLVGRMLLKDPAARFPDGAAVLAAVDDVLAGREVAGGLLGDGGTRPLAVVWPTLAPAVVPVARRPLRTRVLGSATALLVGAGIAVGAISVLAPTAPTPVAAAGTPEPEASPVAVLLTAADHVGRPVDEVEAALAALGLRVERVAEETGRAAPLTVLGMTPTGALRPGDLVTVTYATPLPSSDPPDAGGMPTSAVVAARAEPVTESPSPAPPATSAGTPAPGPAPDGSGPSTAPRTRSSGNGDTGDGNTAGKDGGTAAEPPQEGSAEDGGEGGPNGEGNGGGSGKGGGNGAGTPNGNGKGDGSGKNGRDGD